MGISCHRVDVGVMGTLHHEGATTGSSRHGVEAWNDTI